MSGDVTFPKMTSWMMESEFDHVTVPPTSTTTSVGVKYELPPSPPPPAMPTEAKGSAADDVDELDAEDAVLLWTAVVELLCAEGSGTSTITATTSMMTGTTSITARIFVFTCLCWSKRSTPLLIPFPNGASSQVSQRLSCVADLPAPNVARVTRRPELNTRLRSLHCMAEPFKALQIEVTSRCNASCQYCPRTVLHDRWLSRDMDMALFSRIMDGIGKGLSLVYLQGWGEPLMSPNMAEMIRLVKERSGAEVGLTTNGTLLEEEMTEQLLDAGLDIVGVSFAGAEAETHNELRRGCDFDLVVKNTAEFVRKKGPSGGRVRTIASYTMTRQNVQEIPRFVELCDRIGIMDILLDN